MAKILKDLFATYKGLVPEEEQDTQIPKFNRWDAVNGLMNYLPSKKDQGQSGDDSEEDNGNKSDNKTSYVPTISENAAYQDFIYRINQQLQGVLEQPSQQDSEPTTFTEHHDRGSSMHVFYDQPDSVKFAIKQNPEGFGNFLRQLTLYQYNHPLTEEEKNMLIGIAALESGFKQDAKNNVSSASGWFQFVDKTRNNYTNTSKEQFLGNSQVQIDTAYKHLQDIKKQAKKYVDQYGSNNLTSFQIVRGFWFRPKSMESYMQHGMDTSDNGKAYSDGQGTTLQTILDKAK